jgi:hypothetical protein
MKSNLGLNKIFLEGHVEGSSLESLRTRMMEVNEEHDLKCLGRPGMD